MGAKTLLTVEDLERLPETEGVSYELDEGELIEVTSGSYVHNRNRDAVTHRLKGYLKLYPDQGAVVAEQWFRIAEHTVFAPDVAVIGPEQLSLIEPDRRTQPFSPALAIEITSPSNTFDELASKTRQYLKGGSRSVWIFVTSMHEIHIYSAGAKPRILSGDDVLEDPELLPGFSVRVADLFESQARSTR